MYKTRILASKLHASRSFHILKLSLRFNHYKTLGLREGAPKDQIKKAYIKLTKKYHPDTISASILAKQSEEETSITQEEVDKQIEAGKDKFLKITQAYEALTKKGSTDLEVSDENLSRRDRQQAARRQARQNIDEKLKWKGLEENKKAVRAYKVIRYIVYAGILFNLLILIGATEEIVRYFSIGQIYQEDEVIDECVLRATEEYKKNICVGEKAGKIYQLETAKKVDDFLEKSAEEVLESEKSK